MDRSANRSGARGVNRKRQEGQGTEDAVRVRIVPVWGDGGCVPFGSAGPSHACPGAVRDTPEPAACAHPVSTGSLGMGWESTPADSSATDAGRLFRATIEWASAGLTALTQSSSR